MLRQYYFCSHRYTQEKNRKEPSQPSSPRYGTGRSQFYAEADRAAHEVARSIASVKSASVKPSQDRTLYLSKSTFYDDRPPSPKPCRTPLCMYYGSSANNDYCSRCAKQQWVLPCFFYFLTFKLGVILLFLIIEIGVLKYYVNIPLRQDLYRYLICITYINHILPDE